MVHVRQKAQELVDRWNAEGFNKVRIDAHVENINTLEDYQADYGEYETPEQVKARFDANQRDYACFIVEPDFSFFDGLDRMPYVECALHDNEFWKDITHEIKREMGYDVMINFASGCREFEVIRMVNK